MADEERDDAPEGWHVPFRIGAIGALTVPAVLVTGVFLAGLAYRHTLQPETRFTVTPAPAPGLSAAIHAGQDDPESAPPPEAPDPAIERAKIEVLKTGIAGWQRTP